MKQYAVLFRTSVSRSGRWHVANPCCDYLLAMRLADRLERQDCTVLIRELD